MGIFFNRWYNIFVMFMKEIIEKLKKLNKTISTMESCTGGSLAGEITNEPGASEVFKYGAVTYSNEYKIKMGVSKEVIDKFSVYSMNTADEMSKNISKFANSNYGIGITGKLNRKDINNMSGKDNIVYISIYDKDNDCYYNKEVTVIYEKREENKKYVIDSVIQLLREVL